MDMEELEQEIKERINTRIQKHIEELEFGWLDYDMSHYTKGIINSIE